jgi:Fe-S cluster assembly iron-binding protein IscA
MFDVDILEEKAKAAKVSMKNGGTSGSTPAMDYMMVVIDTDVVLEMVDEIRRLRCEHEALQESAKDYLVAVARSQNDTTLASVYAATQAYKRLKSLLEVQK